MDEQLQDAQVSMRDGTTMELRVPAFPDHPELLRIGGLRTERYAVANDPVVAYGTSLLQYREVAAHDVNPSVP